MKYPIRPQIKGRSICLPPRTGFCLWCEKDLSFDRRRVSFCCNEHAETYYETFVYEDNKKYTILSRDGYKCVHCGFDVKKFREEIEKKFLYIYGDPRYGDFSGIGEKRDNYIKSKGFSLNHSFMEIDHIKAIKMGGDPIDPANQQSLCYPCHKKKTKKDVGLMAQMNAICREIKANIRLKKQQKKMELYWSKIFQ